MKITTKVQKTVQETNFEPVLISCEIEKDVKDYEIEEGLKEIRSLAQDEVTSGMNDWLERK